MPSSAAAAPPLGSLPAAAVVAAPATVKRRRKPHAHSSQQRPTESSREASAESNDETEEPSSSSSRSSSSDAEYRDESVTGAGSGAAAGGAAAEIARENGNAIGRIHARAAAPSASAAAAAPARQHRVGVEEIDLDSEGSAGHDGDVSSANAPSSSFQRRASHPHPHASASMAAAASKSHQVASSSSASSFAPSSARAAAGDDEPSASSHVLVASSRLTHPPSNAITTSSDIASASASPSLAAAAAAASLRMSSSRSLPLPHPLTSPTKATSSSIHDLYSSTPPSPHHSPVIAASRLAGHGGLGISPAWAAAPQGFLSSLTPEEIQHHIRTAIAVPDPNRAYRIMAPPVGRPVRIYADGVYDLLHYGHMLQLRQCKLAFPSVHLIVGVCSDELVRRYKASPVLTSSERYESVRHCKWVDEVIEDAPWCVDSEFLKEHGIDYVAHDEEPYLSAGNDDVYAYAKSIGAFLPTKRTNGVSTSELLQRIVEGYREGEYDNKFIKLGLPDLCSTRNASEAGTTESKPAHEMNEDRSGDFDEATGAAAAGSSI